METVTLPNGKEYTIVGKINVADLPGVKSTVVSITLLRTNPKCALYLLFEYDTYCEISAPHNRFVASWDKE